MLYEIIKRIIDIVSAFIIGLIFLPICLIVAIAIKIDSSGPVFADIPLRVGRNGKQFRLYKFRSMISNAHYLMQTDPKYKKLYEEYKKSSYKIYDDPRWTKIGKTIRKYSVDEVPQLINVFLGEMSLVGPRPYYPDELTEQQNKYPETKDLVTEVLSVKPGVTGEWQVSGRSEINFDKRIMMDAHYVRRKSLVYDMMIILKTPWAMISGKGAV